MAIKKGRMRPPVYTEGVASYPDVFYPETSSDMVKDPVSGVPVSQQINELSDQTAFHDLDNNKKYIITLRTQNRIPQLSYTEVIEE